MGKEKGSGAAPEENQADTQHGTARTLARETSEGTKCSSEVHRCNYTRHCLAVTGFPILKTENLGDTVQILYFHRGEIHVR